jgi:hypothetical protein
LIGPHNLEEDAGVGNDKGEVRLVNAEPEEIIFLTGLMRA